MNGVKEIKEVLATSKTKAVKEISKALMYQMTYVQENGMEMNYKDLIELHSIISDTTQAMAVMWKKGFKAISYVQFVDYGRKHYEA